MLIRDVPRGVQLAAVALAIAILLDIASVVRLLGSNAIPPQPDVPRGDAPRIVISTPGRPDLIHRAALAMPFGEDVPAPLPSATSAVLQNTSPASPRPKLLGTVVDGRGGGFIVVELPDGHMQVVRIGEQAGELRLKSVTAGEAILVDAAGGRVSLRTPQ